MAKFGENILEFKDIWKHPRIPVTCVGDHWFIKVGNCSVVDIKDSKTLHTWKMMQEHLHSFMSSVAYLDGKLYIVMDKNILLRWSVHDNNFENAEQVEFQEEVYSIIPLDGAQPLVIFKSGKFALIDANTFFDLRPSDSTFLKDSELQWVDATVSTSNIEVFYLVFHNEKKTWSLNYFSINKEDKSVSPLHTYKIFSEHSLFKSCCINQDLSFFTLWSDGAVRCYNVKDSKDTFVLSLENISKNTVVDINSIDSTHIVVARGKSMDQECILEIWDIKGAILKGRKDLNLHCGNNIMTVASNDYIFVNAMYKLVAVPFVVDSTFCSTLNTSEGKEFQQHSWNTDLELVQIPASDEPEKMDTSLSQDPQDSVELLLEKLLNQDSADLTFIPESELVKILQLVISCKKNVKKGKKKSGKEMHILLNIIFSAPFNDSLLIKYLKKLNIEDTLIGLDMLLSYLEQNVNMTSYIHDKPSDIQIVNWISLIISSHTEALLFTKEKAAKKLLKSLKKALSAKMEEYEDLEGISSYFFVLQKKDILPQQYSLQNYCLEPLDV